MNSSIFIIDNDYFFRVCYATLYSFPARYFFFRIRLVYQDDAVLVNASLMSSLFHSYISEHRTLYVHQCPSQTGPPDFVYWYSNLLVAVVKGARM